VTIRNSSVTSLSEISPIFGRNIAKFWVKYRQVLGKIAKKNLSVKSPYAQYPGEITQFLGRNIKIFLVKYRHCHHFSREISTIFYFIFNI
jgi:hypothetical protein